MAFAKGKQSTDSVEVKRYIGVGTCKVLAVNPTKDEWNKITGGNMEKEIEYISTGEDGVKKARITLLVQPDKSKTVGEIEPIIPINFWFKKAAVQGSKSGKYQVIDKYGDTAWATAEEIQNKQIPQYSNGPANIDIDYRKMVTGEDVFTNFVKAYLMIPSVRTQQNGQWVERTDKSMCEARLDNILKIFDGDFKEIKEVFSLQPFNKVQILFGVKTADDGRIYQDFFTHLFLTQSNNHRINFAKELTKQLALGRYANTDFGNMENISNLYEYNIEASNVMPNTMSAPTANTDEFDLPASKSNDDDLPF